MKFENFSKYNNPKFLDGRQVAYHMKGIDEYVSIFIFLGPRGGVGSSNTKIQSPGVLKI
jgi:hypothetical protein